MCPNRAADRRLAPCAACRATDFGSPIAAATSAHDTAVSVSKNTKSVGAVIEICTERGIPHDIAMDEQSRIYGEAWFDFLGSSRSMLAD